MNLIPLLTKVWAVGPLNLFVNNILLSEYQNEQFCKTKSSLQNERCGTFGNMNLHNACVQVLFVFVRVRGYVGAIKGEFSHHTCKIYAKHVKPH